MFLGIIAQKFTFINIFQLISTTTCWGRDLYFHLMKVSLWPRGFNQFIQGHIIFWLQIWCGYSCHPQRSHFYPSCSSVWRDPLWVTRPQSVLFIDFPRPLIARHIITLCYTKKKTLLLIKLWHSALLNFVLIIRTLLYLFKCRSDNSMNRNKTEVQTCSDILLPDDWQFDQIIRPTSNSNDVNMQNYVHFRPSEIGKQRWGSII
jgi:hypothetical protein